jgi:hypothetical protein
MYVKVTHAYIKDAIVTSVIVVRQLENSVARNSAYTNISVRRIDVQGDGFFPGIAYKLVYYRDRID